MMMIVLKFEEFLLLNCIFFSPTINRVRASHVEPNLNL